MNKYIDAHIHLQWFDDAIKEIKDALNNGVVGFVCNGTKPDDWDDVITLSVVHDCVRGCVGVHPMYVVDIKHDWAQILEDKLIAYPNLMIGECGLDKNSGDIDLQEQVFRKHLLLGNKLNRAVHIHCVGCWDRMMDIFEDVAMPPKILLHSHHGDAGIIPKLAQYNAYFSYSSILMPENRHKIRACIKETPVDRILVESDAPDLSLSSAVIPTLVNEMARIRGVDVGVFAKVVFENSGRFLGD